VSGAYPPSVELTTLWERTSARGTRCMWGYLGHARVTLLPGDPTENGTPTWRLLLQAAPTRQGEAAERPVIPLASTARRRPYPARSGRPTGQGPVRPNSVAPLPDDAVDDIARGSAT
jgi:hypothetical protein